MSHTIIKMNNITTLNRSRWKSTNLNNFDEHYFDLILEG